MRPEVGTARENEAMEVVGGAHRVDNDVGEGAGTESLHLNVVTEGGENCNPVPGARCCSGHCPRAAARVESSFSSGEVHMFEAAVDIDLPLLGN